MNSMRRLLLGLLVLACTGPSLQSAPADAIRAVLTAQQTAWNAGDIPGFMAYYWHDEQLRFASGGTVTTGWQATLDRYQTRYTPGANMGRLAFSELDIEVFGADDALVFGRWRLHRADGSEPNGLFTLHFRRQPNGAWVIVSDHTSSTDE